ncbi:glycoside hydrolase family 3 C-terminal domain-containing protein [Phenylobacterium sp. LjRoot219]|uniref:glycoside hydrolase family 3 N-terminal domain-containing protein n=1 Tax=Phenylobacterium sp. LjRoot219 TaxID=3342283 RepID=UPI003ED046D5
MFRYLKKFEGTMRGFKRLLAQALLAGSCLSILAGAPAAGREPAKARAAMSDEAVRARADALIAQMTPEEKAGQLSQFFYLQPMPPANKPALEALGKGQAGAMLFVTDPAEANRLQKIAVEQTRLKIPLLFGFDVIHGLRTIFPVPLGMAASWDPQLVEQSQAVAAAEARAVGVHWAFAPMLDIARDPRWGRIVEGPGEDPYLGSAMAVAQVKGFQGDYIGAPNRIIAGPKHFAGYGASLGGRDYDEVNLSDNELWNVYLPPFKAAVDAGAGNVMAAYMGLNGVPAAGNHWLLTKVLRETWGFKGFVVSDANGVQSLAAQGLAVDKADAAVRALQAGIDLEMSPPMTPAAMPTLVQSLNEGKITQAQLDDAVRRVLEAKIRMGLFENPYVDPAKAEAVLDDPAHLQLARVAAERSAVLLKNEGGLLPLDRKGIKSIAVIGPLADSARDTLGPWVFPQNKPQGASVLSGLKAKLGPAVRVDYSEGVRMPPRTFPSPMALLDPPQKRAPLDETAEIQRAVGLAKAADVAVLVLGEGQDMIGEAASRASLDLPGRQQELLDAVVATGKPVVVLLMSARPLNLKETQAAAILDIWYPGSAGGEAAANLLFGEANPGGKLPFTWIRDAAHAPNPYAQLISHAPKDADKRYWAGSSAPTWPFGHGLSYTSFKYANLRIERPSYRVGEAVGVSVELSNAGARAGDEVAQLYIHQRSGTSARPVRELKGFQRVSLKPGETRILRFTLKPDDLRYWSAVTGGWVQDEAAFDVWVGGDSKAELAGTFEVRGR